ncbi:hypothetical protein NHX12_010979 [Muraenolepis orangiensis]|uniref:Ig-like domain-containing protein n=1 Tax=Muraenolepis orangiensis TaxID=630683 RepID=A0A9Q0I8D4_9TELE|nr:hypothetical protein NHX12_010979 [Muraenolepis orangiensis]
MRWVVLVQVVFCCLGTGRCFCPAQCSCVPQGRGDGAGSSSVVCNDPDMADLPLNVPVDTVKLRVEKTAVRRIPTEAFYYLVELRFLWITYNAISSVDRGSFYNLKVLHELRLDGNLISVFPWDSLKETPALRTLDLHNNRLTGLPAEAVVHLQNITYLDLSSLQDNPWICDCRISKVLELSKMVDAPVVLMDPFVSCAGPQNLAGVLFQRAEPDRCVKPSVMTSATKITSPLGSNLLIRCDATGLPTPSLVWTKSDGSPANNTVQESPSEGVRWSVLSLVGVLSGDAGTYSCSARNPAGSARALVSVSVTGGDDLTTLLPVKTSGVPETTITPPISTAVPSTTSTTTSSTTTTTTTTTPLPSSSSPPTDSPRPSTPPFPLTERKSTTRPSRVRPGGDNRKLAADATGGKTDISRALGGLGGLRVVEEGPDSAVLLWTAEGVSRDSSLTAVCSPYGGDRDQAKRTQETTAGSGKLLLERLSPGMRYSVCLVARDTSSEKDPCVDFYTLDSVGGGEAGGYSVLLLASWVACVLALPLIALLLYKILALYCSRSSSGGLPEEERLDKESYVKFETVSVKQRSPAFEPDRLWPRRQTRDSERLLLCSQSSFDSQVTYKSDTSEYLC